jgi:O-antigen/teichoic acid export membrane protein
MIKLDDPSVLSIGQRLKFLATDAALYGGAAALNKAFGLITFPLLTRHFSVADYGIIDFFTVLASLFAIIFIFGQDSAVARFFYEHKDLNSRKQLISQSLLLQMSLVLVTIPFFLLSAGTLASKLNDSPVAELLIRIILLQVPFLVLINFSQNLLKWSFCRGQFLFISLGSVILNVLLLLIAVFIFNIEVIGVFIVTFAVQIVFGLLGLFFVRHWLTIPDGFAHLRELVPYAIPYGVVCCLGAFVPALERSLVTNLLGSNDLGLYAAGAKVAILISLPIQAFQTAWGPFSLAIHKENNAAETYNWVLKGFVVGVCIIALLLALLGESVLQVLASERYSGAAVVIFPLAMGMAIQSTSWITEIGIGFSKKSYLGLFSYMLFVVTTAIGIYFFTQHLGLMGVALGVMIGHIAKALMATYLAQRAYPLSWSFKPLFILIAYTIAIGISGQIILPRFIATSGASVLATGIVFLLPISWFCLFRKDERQKIIGIVGTSYGCMYK